MFILSSFSFSLFFSQRAAGTLNRVLSPLGFCGTNFMSCVRAYLWEFSVLSRLVAYLFLSLCVCMCVCVYEEASMAV
jgi:hypothetical protein